MTDGISQPHERARAMPSLAEVPCDLVLFLGGEYIGKRCVRVLENIDLLKWVFGQDALPDATLPVPDPENRFLRVNVSRFAIYLERSFNKPLRSIFVCWGPNILLKVFL